MTREEVIKVMYQYKAREEDMLVVPDSQEVIHNWYIVGFPDPDVLSDMIPLEDIYDSEPTYKIYVKDRYEP